MEQKNEVHRFLDDQIVKYDLSLTESRKIEILNFCFSWFCILRILAPIIRMTQLEKYIQKNAHFLPKGTDPTPTIS